MSVFAMAAAATGVYLAGQARTQAESKSTRMVPVKDKSPTTRPSASCCKRQAKSKPAQATSKPATSRPAPATTRPSTPTVIVYYFHRTLRCPTCRSLEELAKQAVETGFADELDLGVVKWQTLNVEQEGNGHFVKDFKLERPSLVLAKTRDGKQVEWKNMEKIWELVRSPNEYTKYVQDGLRGYLRESQQDKPRRGSKDREGSAL